MHKREEPHSRGMLILLGLPQQNAVLKNCLNPEPFNCAVPHEGLTGCLGFLSPSPFRAVCLRLSLLVWQGSSLVRAPLEAPCAAMLLPGRGNLEMLCFVSGLQFLLFASQNHEALNISF